jgi:hypothetical protein
VQAHKRFVAAGGYQGQSTVGLVAIERHLKPTQPIKRQTKTKTRRKKPPRIKTL